MMSFHRSRSLVFSLCMLVGSSCLLAQDDATPEKHGRKYKPPPDTAHIEVMVQKGFNKKPIMNAAVIFHPIVNGKDEGTLEVKSGPDGKASIDVIPKGSQVRLQVLANGYATFAEDYVITEATKSILVEMQRPQAQVSAYIDTEGKPAQLTPGLQEPVRTKKATPPAASNPGSGSTGSAPAPAAGSDSTSKPQQ